MSNLCKKLVLDAFYNILRNEHIWWKKFRETSVSERQNHQITHKIAKKTSLYKKIKSLKASNLCKKLVLDAFYNIL